MLPDRQNIMHYMKTYAPDRSNRFSLYSLIAEGMLPVNQYSMTFVNNSSLVKRDSKHVIESFLLHPDHVKNFSMTYAARPTGESFNATPILSGLVAKNTHK